MPKHISIKVYYDEAYARMSAAWFWRLSDDTPDDDPVGPYRTKADAVSAAREALAYREGPDRRCCA